MGASSSIEWTDATWNPTRGCTRVSQGCVNCYAEVMAARFSDPGMWGHGFAEMKGRDHRWTGNVQLIESQITLPLHWKKPRKIFVNSTSDLFHESLPDEALDRVFAVMALCPQHTFQVLTKRPKRMREYIRPTPSADGVSMQDRLWSIFRAMRVNRHCSAWPLPNVWLGTSVEDQATADERIPHLLQTPGAIRFVSYEPALGLVDFSDFLMPVGLGRSREASLAGSRSTNGVSAALDWIICGGESGANARPMHPDWARSVRDQCAAAGVKFFFKQWGRWEPCSFDGRHAEAEHVFPDGTAMLPVGKKAAGRLLDGVEHNGFPDVAVRARAE